MGESSDAQGSAMDIINRSRNLQRRIISFELDNQAVDDCVAHYYYTHFHKEPCYTARGQGREWVEQLMEGHLDRSYNMFRMETGCFRELCNTLGNRYGLAGSRNIPIHEKVGMFLYMVSQGASTRVICEHFQHSPETVNRTIHQVLDTITGRKQNLIGLTRDMLKPRDPTFSGIPSRISSNQRFMPFKVHVSYCR